VVRSFKFEREWNVVYALMRDNITQDIKNVKILPVDEWGKWVYGDR
jgi:hypothetical protein